MDKLKSAGIFIAIVGVFFLLGSKWNKEDTEYLQGVHKKIAHDVGPRGYLDYDSDNKHPMVPNPLPSGYHFGWEEPIKDKVKTVNQNTQMLTEKLKNNNLSDEEIRILREKQSYINGYLYTPGRIVPTREQEIHNYIEEHGQEIYEQLEDEYGN